METQGLAALERRPWSHETFTAQTPHCWSNLQFSAHFFPPLGLCWWLKAASESLFLRGGLSSGRANPWQPLDFVGLQGKAIRTCLQQQILWWKLLNPLVGSAMLMAPHNSFIPVDKYIPQISLCCCAAHLELETPLLTSTPPECVWAS